MIKNLQLYFLICFFNYNFSLYACQKANDFISSINPNKIYGLSVLTDSLQSTEKDAFTATKFINKAYIHNRLFKLKESFFNLHAETQKKILNNLEYYLYPESKCIFINWAMINIFPIEVRKVLINHCFKILKNDNQKKDESTKLNKIKCCIALKFVALPRNFQQNIINLYFDHFELAEWSNYIELNQNNCQKIFQTIMSYESTQHKAAAFLQDLLQMNNKKITKTLNISQDPNASKIIQFIKNFQSMTIEQTKNTFDILPKNVRDIIKTHQYLSPIITFAQLPEDNLINIFKSHPSKEYLQTCIGGSWLQKYLNFPYFDQYVTNQVKTNNIYNLFIEAYDNYHIILLKKKNTNNQHYKYRPNYLRIPSKVQISDLQKRMLQAQNKILTKSELQIINEIEKNLPAVERAILWDAFFYGIFWDYHSRGRVGPEFLYRNKSFTTSKHIIIAISCIIVVLSIVQGSLYYLFMLIMPAIFYAIIKYYNPWVRHIIEPYEGETIEQFLNNPHYEISDTTNVFYKHTQTNCKII